MVINQKAAICRVRARIYTHTHTHGQIGQIFMRSGAEDATDFDRHVLLYLSVGADGPWIDDPPSLSLSGPKWCHLLPLHVKKSAKLILNIGEIIQFKFVLTTINVLLLNCCYNIWCHYIQIYLQWAHLSRSCLGALLLNCEKKLWGEKTYWFSKVKCNDFFLFFSVILISILYFTWIVPL